MRFTRSIILFVLSSLVAAGLNGQDYKTLTGRKGLERVTDESGITTPVTVSIIYDNYLFAEGLQADWGYSIAISGLEKEVIFDAGTKTEVFELNFKKMGIDASSIDMMVISHEHGDHTGGIKSFAAMKNGIPVIIPHSFSSKFRSEAEKLRLTPVLVDGPSEICANLYTSGEFDYNVAEQALVLDTRNGLVVMTGCSHPGIVGMLKEIQNEFNKNIFMVLGGFHLLDKSEKEMEEIISEMKKLGIKKCGATHCTGDRQIKQIKEAFGDGYFGLGAGNKLVIN